MNLKPFNLEEALAGKPVVTRGGRKVTEIYHFKTANQDQFPITAIIDKEKFGYDLSGHFMGSGETEYDLFMAPETLQVFINVYKEKDGHVFGVLLKTEKGAEYEKSIKGSQTFLKTVPVTIEL